MLSLDFKDAHPDTNWKVIVAMRHFLVHGYYQVDPEEVWNVIEQDLQPLKEQKNTYQRCSETFSQNVVTTYIFRSSSTLGTFNLQDALETPSYSSLMLLMIFFISSLTLSG